MISFFRSSGTYCNISDTPHCKTKQDKFEKSEDRAVKLETLKTIIADSEKYSEGKKAYKKAEDLYKEKIEAMRKYFTDEYDKTVKDNTVADVEKATKDELKTAKEKLETLVSTITEEKETTFADTKKADEKIAEINKTIASYTTKIEALEKKEAEEQAKAQQQASKSSSSSSSKSYSKKNNSSSSSSKGNSSSSNKKPWNYGMTYRYNYDLETGKKTLEWWEDRNGNQYDMNGNYIGNSGDWGFM